MYLANATGLDLVSPPAFMEAVAEGNDPPAQSIVQFDQLITNGTVKVLVYNAQTVTPLTQSTKALASQYNIPIVRRDGDYPTAGCLVPSLDECAVNHSSKRA